MKCFLPPHKPAFFDSYDEYEVHYQQNHANRCLECGKNFPTEHYLGLHIAENHDPLNETLRERGEKTVSILILLHSQLNFLALVPQMPDFNLFSLPSISILLLRLTDSD